MGLPQEIEKLEALLEKRNRLWRQAEPNSFTPEMSAVQDDLKGALLVLAPLLIESVRVLQELRKMAKNETKVTPQMQGWTNTILARAEVEAERRAASEGR